MPDDELASILHRPLSGLIELRRRRRRTPFSGIYRLRYDWTPRRDAWLGRLPDAEIGRRVGCTPQSVMSRRRKLGIPACNPRNPSRPWTPVEEKLLGFFRDDQVARRLGRSIRAVRDRRAKYHIPACPAKLRPWTPKELALLGKFTDAEVAHRIGRLPLRAYQKRVALGIPCFKPSKPLSSNRKRRTPRRPKSSLKRSH
jgi:hypothetical protein